MYVINRAPNDDFTYNLFSNIVESFPAPAEKVASVYVWTNPPDIITMILDQYAPEADYLLFATKDILITWEEYNYWEPEADKVVKTLDQFIEMTKDKKVIVFTSVENYYEELKRIGANTENVNIISYGSDCTNQMHEYLKLEPVTEKNFESNKWIINLNRTVKQHRDVVVSYLYGLGLDKHAHITYAGLASKSYTVETREKDFLEVHPWDFPVDEGYEDHRQIIIDGFRRHRSNPELYIDDEYDDERLGHNDNVGNFNIFLRKLYKDSFIEIVCETLCDRPSWQITEKTINSFYGMNFPIIISGRGEVAVLRDMGFDMFDDILDHSYDSIDDPFMRIYRAIDDNYHLLTDGVRVKQLWKDNEDRFLKNVKCAKNIYNYYENRTLKQVDDVLKKWGLR